MSLTVSQRFRLGIFVVIGTALLLVFSIVPIIQKASDRHKRYFASFTGESLSGLEQGAIVKFHGVPIGKAERIMYDPNNLLRVRVALSVQAEFPMKTDMYCRTGDMGITGLKYIEVLGGTNEAPLLKPESEIPTRLSTMSMITGKAEVIVAKVEVLLNHLNELSNPDSLHSIKTIVDNVAAITADVHGFLAQARPQLEAVTADVHGFIAETRPELETSARSLSRIVTRVDSISRDMSVIASEIGGGVGRGKIREIIASIESTSRSLNVMSDEISLIVRQSREDITVSMTNLRQALQNANELTRILAENPSLLLKGEQQKARVIR